MPHHAEAAMWSEGHSRRWFARGDQCGKRLLVADYYEVYPPMDGPDEERGWWWACSYCLMGIINERFDALMKRMEDALTKLEDARPSCKRVSMCCDAEEVSPGGGYVPPSICSSCCKLAEFDCAACGDLWPDREGECLGQENL